MCIINSLGSTRGRWVRGVIGVVFIVSGIIIGGADLWLLVPGIIFLIAAISDVCVLAPFIGRPVRGSKFRSDEGCS